MTDYWSEGAELTRETTLPTETNFFAWYQTDGEVDTTRTVPDRVLEETNKRIVANPAGEDQGLLKLLCVTDPDTEYSMADIERLMPAVVTYTRTKPGNYPGKAADEIPTETFTYRLVGLALAGPLATQSYSQVRGGR